MTWRDKLLVAASFRGVPFFVQGHDSTLGRRVHVHEYPLRDQPYAEDLGRKGRTFSVDALVVGALYIGQRNALLAAVEAAGPGKLVHPYLGEMLVACTSCRLREGQGEGGMARLALEFVEAGKAEFPTVLSNTIGTCVATADYAAQAVQSNFERRHKVAGKPAFVANASAGIFTQALAGLQDAVGLVRGAADEVAKLQHDIDEARRDLTTLIYAPASAAQTLLANVRQLVRSVATAPRDALSLARTLYRFGALLPAISPSTTSRRAQATNQAELVRLVRVAALAEGARAAAGVAFESYQDALATRDELVDSIDEVMLASDVPDEVYQALRALRSAVVRDIAARGTDLARVVTWAPLATAPSLALAQQLYADALREPELVQRNAVRHPLFVPGAIALEVLSDAL